jgi:hypothetical protein
MELQVINKAELRNQLQLLCPSAVGDEKFISTWIGNRVNNMDEEDFKDSVNFIVAEICLLNGLETYDADSQTAMYIAQMRVIARFISDGFPYLTPAEISNAFNLNLQGKFKEVFKQFGKRQINCEFIGQVLTAYKEYKQNYVDLNPDLLHILYPPAPLPVPKVWTDEDDENERRIDINRLFYDFLINPNWNYQLLDYRLYDQLEKDGALKEGFYKKLEKACRLKLLQEKQKEHLMPTSTEKIRTKLADGSIGKILSNHYDLKDSINSELHQIRTGSQEDEVVRFAKQTSIKLYFEELLADGKRTVYVKEKKEE